MGKNCQHHKVRSDRAANDLTCQQYEPHFRGQSWTTAESPLSPTKVLSRIGQPLLGVETETSFANVASVSGPKSHRFEPLARDGGLENNTPHDRLQGGESQCDFASALGNLEIRTSEKRAAARAKMKLA